MPQITPSQKLDLGNKAQAGRYITFELLYNVDMLAIAINQVPSCDWASFDLPSQLNGRSLDFDISQHVQQAGMLALQSVYIDNGPNNCSMTLEVSATRQRITCPPHSQGWFALICASKDGKFRISSVDKDAANGNVAPSWYYPASAAGPGLTSIYRPALIFTDQPIPPTVWDVRLKSSSIGAFSAYAFATTNPEVISRGPACRRMGFGFRAAESNVTAIAIEKFQYGSLTVSPAFWTLLPGESIRWEGESCPTDIFYGQALTVGDFIYRYLQV